MRASTSVSHASRRVCHAHQTYPTYVPRAMTEFTSLILRSSRYRLSIPQPLKAPNARNYSSTNAKTRKLPLSMLLAAPLIWYLYDYFRSKSPDLSPTIYSDHPCSAKRILSDQHVEITVQLPYRSIKRDPPQISLSEANTDDKDSTRDNIISVQHFMIKNPDLMIERPYTPINNFEDEGEVKLVVKRVKGGEVGRMIHSLQPGQNVGLRGPLPTFSINPALYDRIVMISTGTGVAPFIQLLNKLPPISSKSSPSLPATNNEPQLDLIHALPENSLRDWLFTGGIIKEMNARHAQLNITRFDMADGPREALAKSINGRRKDEKLLVLVCASPHIMKAVCGPLTPNLQQGEVTGILRDLGLTSSEVWKLE